MTFDEGERTSSSTDPDSYGKLVSEPSATNAVVKWFKSFDKSELNGLSSVDSRIGDWITSNEKVYAIHNTVYIVAFKPDAEKVASDVTFTWGDKSPNGYYLAGENGAIGMKIGYAEVSAPAI